MNVSIYLKKFLANLLNLVGTVDYRLNRIRREDYLILMYHRVLNHVEVDETIEPGMYITPETFEKHLCFLKEKFDVIPLSKVSKNESKRSSRSAIKCAITFDDGWLDFYTHAYPLLVKYNLPAINFLPTSFIGRREIFWTDKLAKILKQKKTSNSRELILLKKNNSMDNLVEKIIKMNGPITQQLNCAIVLLKTKHQNEIDQILDELSYVIKFQRPAVERSFLSWKEIYEMKQSNLISFGSHTANHSILTTLNDEETIKELISSKQTLKEKNVLDSDCIPFCYPNGDCNNRIANLVEKCGYSLAVTTRKGWNKGSTNPYLLNRIGLHEDVSFTRSMFACRIFELI